jgi:hypothetical protein
MRRTILRVLNGCRRYIERRLALWRLLGALEPGDVDPLERARRKAHRARPAPWPPRHPEGDIDWSDMDYVEVNNADYAHPARSLDELMAGPMKRMFDLCGEDKPVRVSARILEFARGPAFRFRDRRPDRTDEIERVLMLEVQRQFAHRGSDGAYLIDVYLGKRDHNG